MRELMRLKLAIKLIDKAYTVTMLFLKECDRDVIENRPRILTDLDDDMGELIPMLDTLRAWSERKLNHG